MPNGPLVVKMLVNHIEVCKGNLSVMKEQEGSRRCRQWLRLDILNIPEAAGCNLTNAVWTPVLSMPQ
jgi:hypothetical protein